jgi:hypothetical protein
MRNFNRYNSSAGKIPQQDQIIPGVAEFLIAEAKVSA